MPKISLRQPMLWSVAAPLLCSVHCIATPVLLLFAPVLAPQPAWEAWLKLRSVFVAAAVGLHGVCRHRRWAVLLPVAAGPLLWAAAAANGMSGAAEAATTVLGSTILAAGIVWNAGLVHEVTCRRCGCPAHANR